MLSVPIISQNNVKTNGSVAVYNLCDQPNDQSVLT